MSLQLTQWLIIEQTVSLLIAAVTILTQVPAKVITPTMAYAVEIPTEIPLEAPVVPVEAPKPTPKDEVACNCYLYVKQFVPSFPRTYELIANSLTPVVGGVVFINYSNVMHYMVITAIAEDGIYIKESNFTKCEYSNRFLTFTYLKDRGAKYWYNI